MEKIFEVVVYKEWIKIVITSLDGQDVVDISSEWFPIDGPTAIRLLKGDK